MPLRAVFFVLVFSMTAPLVSAEPVPIWPEGTPNAKGEGEGHVPTLTWYPAPSEGNTGACVLVLPGGGYNHLADTYEGVQVAQWFNSFGVNAYVHHYRLKKAGYTPKDSLDDALQAMRMARKWAPERGYSPDRIGILGFSAGGHLSAMTTLTSSVGSKDSGPTEDEKAARPDFAFMLYPAYLYVFPEEEYGVPPQPNKNVPPIFLAVSGQDSKYEMTSIKIFENFKPAGVDVELHAFGGWGPHGLGLGQGDTAFGQWPGLAQDWLRRQGMLTDAQRCESMTLKVTNCDKPVTGFARLTPVGDPNKPAVSVRSGRDGVFSFKDRANKPYPGIHTLSLWIYPEKPELGVLDMDPVAGVTIDILPGENEIQLESFRLPTKKKE